MPLPRGQVSKVAGLGPRLRHLAGRSGVLHAVSGDDATVWPRAGRETIKVKQKHTVAYRSAADITRNAKEK
jgi:hypothetical protein